ncbi:nitrate- and nitrite sensing domain-containing protein [Streptomyces sp. NPDC048340]|uniref:sensor histidine kinase n=1 Tax=Streptomyces sp. NPDC048340 TaxID=3365537 RepID=UPI0037194855
MISAGLRPPLPWRKRVLADLRVPTRMLIVVLVPLLAALGFAGLRIDDALRTAGQYGDTERIAQTSRTGTALIAALAQERDLAVDPRARPRGTDAKGRDETDARARQFLKELGGLPAHSGMERQRKVTGAGLESLAKIRKMADAQGSPAEVEHDYGGVIVSIASLYNQVGGIGEEARGAGWTLYTVALNNVMVTSQRSVLASAAQSGSLSTGQQGNILASQLVRDITGMEFGLYADPHEAESFQRILADEPARNLTAAISALGASTGQTNPAKALPKTWYEDLTRVSEQLAQLQEKVERRVLASAAQQKDRARDQVVVDVVLAALVLLLASALVFATSRHLVRGLGWLRRSAAKVADDHLPEVTRHLSRGSALPAALEGKVLAPRTRDEIGDVARAFDRVYLEAVGLARQQAAMREEVNQLFQNLSRRNQGLIQRQLAVITELEGHEQSPDGLARLFHLDHLATRIRRNSENLLVLAGAEITAERRESTELLPLVRTATSEIEEYQRVTYRTVPPVSIVGYAADDLVHLIAELLDNAASFSSPDTWVVVSGQRMPDGRVLLEIRDSGIGMGEEQLAAAGQVLHRSAGGRADLSESMGLYVVGALARKHGVDVRLYPNSPAGLVAALVLPEALLGPAAPTAPEQAPAPAPRRPGPAAGAGSGRRVVRGHAVAPRPDAHRAGEEHPTLAIRAVDPDTTAAAPAPAHHAAPQQQPEDPRVHESTSAGLPVRRRRPRAGSITAPAPAPAPAPEAAAFPDPAEILRRMSGLDNGIAQAAETGAGPRKQNEKEEE